MNDPFNICKKIASDAAEHWREVEKEWQIPKSDATAIMMRSMAKHRAETAESIVASIEEEQLKVS